MAKKKKKVKKVKKAPRQARGKAKKAKKAKKVKGPKPIGRVTHWFGKLNVAVIKLLVPFKVGDYLHFKGAHADFVQRIDSMQINHKFVDKARKGVEVGLKVKQKVREDYLVFKPEKPVKQTSFQPILSQPLIKRETTPRPIQAKPQKPTPPKKPGGYGDVKFFKF